MQALIIIFSKWRPNQVRVNWIFRSTTIANLNWNLEVAFIQREDQKQPFTQYDVSLIFLLLFKLTTMQQDPDLPALLKVSLSFLAFFLLNLSSTSVQWLQFDYFVVLMIFYILKVYSLHCKQLCKKIVKLAKLKITSFISLFF